MSNFAEPSATLCGARHPYKDAVCVKRVNRKNGHHENEIPGTPHVWVATVEVMQRLDATLTPCRWYDGPWLERERRDGQ